jgi:hypothetical protein
VKRRLGSIFAFVFGLSGSFAAVSASESDGRTVGALLGPIDFARYCTEVYGPQSVAVADSPGGSSWGCAARNNGLFDTFDVDTDDACSLLFGNPTFSRSWDISRPESWECFYGSGP